MNDLVKQAKKFAREKHVGQKRISGEDYFEHPNRVAEIVKKYEGNSKELIAAAYLHDVLEDTETNVDELKVLFGDKITKLVVEMTTDKIKGELVGKTKYLSDKLSDEKLMSCSALIIKLADRLDNVGDLNELDRKFSKRRKEETKIILDKVEKNRNLSRTHKELIKEIRKKLEGFDDSAD